MSNLEKLIEKIDELCQKIQRQKEEIEILKKQNEEFAETLSQKDQELSNLLSNQSNENQKLEALFSRMERALNDSNEQ